MTNMQRYLAPACLNIAVLVGILMNAVPYNSHLSGTEIKSDLALGRPAGLVNPPHAPRRAPGAAMKPEQIPKNLDALNKRLERLGRTSTHQRHAPIVGVKTLNSESHAWNAPSRAWKAEPKEGRRLAGPAATDCGTHPASPGVHRCRRREQNQCRPRQ